jgi:hypothetical protein
MSEEEKAEETQVAQEEGVEQGQPLTPREMLEKEAQEETAEETQEESEETSAEETEETPAETEEATAEETEETPEETLEPLEEEETETPESIPYGAFKERIGKKNEQIEAERARARELEEENQRLKSGQARTAPAAPVGYTPEAAPKRDDFEDEDAYLDARAAWSGREAFREEQAKSDAAAAQKAEEDRVAAVKQKAQETARDYIARTETILTKARAENPERYSDFDAREEAVRSAGLSHEAVQSLVTAEDPVKIVNYLGGKTEELQRIAKLSPLEQVEEIGYLKRRASVKPKERKIPKAPTPPNPPQGGGDTEKRKVSDSMSDAEFARATANAIEKGASARSLLE